MGTTQGEIRVGPSHQAKLPENRSCNLDLSPDPEFSKEREERRWIPCMTLDGDLVMYLRAARSVAAFAGMCNGGSAEDGCIVASRDETTMNALDVLHDCGYDPGKALQALVKCPVPKGVERKWSDEEVKRFMKGLKQYGKNFHRIRKEYFSYKETWELVEFYYLWKKSAAANNNRSHRRRRQGSLRRNRNTRSARGSTPKEEIAGTSSRPSSNLKDQGDGSSGSDDDNNSYCDDSDSRDNLGYRCQHCLSTKSRDWQHATSGPKQGALLCYSCRSYCKEFGELPPTTGRSEAPYLFKPVQAESPDGSPSRMRTRNKAKETPTKEKPRNKKGDSVDADNDRKLTNGNETGSPSSSSNSPYEKTKKKGKGENGNKKRSLDSNEPEDTKRKRERTESPMASDLSDMDSGEEGETVTNNNKDPKIDVASEVIDKEEEEDEAKPEDIDSAVVTSYDQVAAIAEPEINTNTPFLQVKKDYYMPPSVEEAPQLELMPKLSEEVYNENRVKNQGSFDSSPDDEMPPPVLSTDEGYVPKDEMPTLQISAGIGAEPFSPTDNAYPADYGTLPLVKGIKLEPGVEEHKAGRITPNQRLLPDSGTPPPTLVAEDVISPAQAASYGHVPEIQKEISEAEKSQQVFPPYSSYEEETERVDKTFHATGIPTEVSMDLSQVQHPAYPYFPFQSQSHLEKVDSQYAAQNSHLQIEPQDLKIKQEVILPDQCPPPVDPLQSLKEVKVPGYPVPSVSQQLLASTSSTPVLPVSGTDVLPPYAHGVPISEPCSPSEEMIKKEAEYLPGPLPPPQKSPAVSFKGSEDMPRNISPSTRSLTRSPSFLPPIPPSSSGARTSPTPSPIISVPVSATHALPPPPSSPLSRVSPAHLAHPHSAYVPPMHPHHPLLQHPLFAAAAAAAHAAAVHHGPYPPTAYPGYPYPFPYGPYPIPQPIPPPSSRSADPQKREMESSSTVVHQTSSSSSITSRSVRDEDHSQEITQTHHSTSHHASVHHHSDKQTISHSTSSSSSASIQHKIKRSSSPQHPTCHVSATLSQSTSSSISTNHGQNSHHHHHHQHTHHHQTSMERVSPLLSMGTPLGPSRNNVPTPSMPQSKQHPQSIMPPSALLAGHHPGLPLAGLQPSGSLEALRAHAHALHPPLQMQPSPHLGMPPGHPGYLTPGDMSMAGASELMKNDQLLPPEDPLLGSQDDDEIPSPTHHIPKGPSPEPKIEDSECHRSQSAIFLRHWNRGDYNSCARTDLTFKPVPDSKLARKREERIRKQAEREREEREKAHARKISTPDKAEAPKPPSHGPVETITSPYDRFARTPYPDSPALRQLSEYARPHTGFSPVSLQRSAATLGIPPQCIDPMLHYQLNMYGPTARERLDIEHFEREKRERELRELREKELNDRLKEEIMKTAGARIPNAIDPHWLDLQRRFGALGPGGPAVHPFGLYAAAAAAGPPGQPAALSPLERERLERLGTAFSRPGLIPSRDSAAMGLHHPADLLTRPYADQLAQQAAVHEHLQRQMLIERERYSHPALVAQHEEYLRKLYLM